MKRRVEKISACILAGLILLESIFINVNKDVYSEENGTAKREQAVTWLMENQNGDGSWGEKQKLHDTCEVLKHVDKKHFEGSENRGKAVEWLNLQKISNNDDLFQLYSIEELQQNADVADITKLQNADGGWSMSKNYSSDVFDTLLAIQSCLNSEEVHTKTVNSGIAFLLINQMENGGFSYADEEANVYLTAYAAEVMEQYTRTMGRNDESTKIALDKAESFLLESEDENTLWGVGENDMLTTLMASIALVEKDEEKTLERINIIAEKIIDNGSLYDNPVLTAMFIKLVDLFDETENEKRTAGIEDIYVYTEEGKDIEAYTEVFIEPAVKGFDKETMTVSVVVGTKESGYKAVENKGGVFVWNTENTMPGKYEIYGILTDNKTGNVLGIKKKVCEVKESFKVSNTYFSYSPKMYRIGSGKKIDFSFSADIQSNIKKEIKAEIHVKDDSGNVLYSDSESKICGEDIIYADFNDFGFIPELAGKKTLHIEILIKSHDATIKKMTGQMMTYESGEENRIEIEYSLNKDYIVPEEDEAVVNFDMKGVGLSEEIKRKPMDIVMVLDDSGSMSKADWDQSRAAAEKLVEFMQSEDRAAVIYLNRSKPLCELTSEKETIIKAINYSNSANGRSTKIGENIDKALKLYGNDADREKVLYIFSDGVPTDGKNGITKAEKAAEAGVTIYTLGLRESGADFLKTIADIGKGTYVYSPTNEELTEMMEELAGDIFKVAGSDVRLSMTIGSDIPFENVSIEPQPDETYKKEDGSTEIVFLNPYISVGNMQDFDISFNIPGFTQGKMINLIKNIKLEYTDQSDERIVRELAPVNVRVVNTNVSGNVDTDKDSYDTNEDVRINVVAKKEAADKSVTGVIEITDEKGATVEVINDKVIIEDEINRSFIWNTGDVMPGEYKVVISWYRNGKITDSRECSFTVKEEKESTTGKESDDEEDNDEEKEDDFIKLKGGISVSEKEVLTGVEVKASYDVKNLGNTEIHGAEVKVSLVNVDDETTKEVDSGTYDMDVSGEMEKQASINTENLKEGAYIVMLTAQYGEEQMLLGATGFEVNEPQYNLTVNAKKGGAVNTEVSGMYKENSKVELVAVADEGYIFAGWKSDSSGTFENNNRENTAFIMPAGDVTVTAMFVKAKEDGNASGGGLSTEEGNLSGEGSSTEDDNSSADGTSEKDGLPEENEGMTSADGNESTEEPGENNGKNQVTKGNDTDIKPADNKNGDDTGKDKTNEAGKNSLWNVVKTGDFGERAVIIRNITVMLLVMVLISMLVVKRDDEKHIG